MSHNLWLIMTSQLVSLIMRLSCVMDNHCPKRFVFPNENVYVPAEKDQNRSLEFYLIVWLFCCGKLSRLERLRFELVTIILRNNDEFFLWKIAYCFYERLYLYVYSQMSLIVVINKFLQRTAFPIFFIIKVFFWFNLIPNWQSHQQTSHCATQ